MVQSTLEETKILDEEVLRKLLNEPNQQPPADANQDTSNTAVRAPSDKKFDEPVGSAIQRSPDKKSPTTQPDLGLAKQDSLEPEESLNRLPWIIAGVLLVGILALFFKIFKGKSTS